jgi:hypothetical protein
MRPTDEQQRALAMFAAGDSMVIEAGAGTGKTSTLELLARSARARGQYMAFNKAIVMEAGRRMPDNVASSTAHSLAFRAVGHRYKHRLNSPRMRSTELAERLRLTPWTVEIGEGTRELHEAYLAGLVMRAIAVFCNSADDEPGVDHVPYIDGIDMPAEGGKRTWDNNREVRRHVLPALGRAWEDLRDPKGQLPFRHDHYLKAWQLGRPRIDAEFILFDEAQDASPVMDAVVAAQEHAQVVLVGDANQAIYGWRGAVNAIARMRERLPVSMLTQSFRFGPAIAEVANLALERLEADLRLRGTPSIASRVELLADSDAVLCRTNAVAVQQVLAAKQAGRRPHLVGGGAEVSAFARAAAELQAGIRTAHPELACFVDWSEVQRYVADDPQGSELRLMVRLVDEYTVPVILSALERMPEEKAADLVVSTAHKAKGREWRRVRIAADFKDEDLGEEEWRLAYVAVTRARDVLDPGPIGAGSIGQPRLDESPPPTGRGPM